MKEIIDAHFLSHYSYYCKVCRLQFGGRYLWEDLLQETYLKLFEINPKTIEFFNEIGKLNCIVIRTIKSLHQERKRGKKNAQGHTSPLFEVSSSPAKRKASRAEEDDYVITWKKRQFEVEDLVEDSPNPLQLAQEEETIQRQFGQANELIHQALSEPVGDGKEISDFLKVRVFVDVQKSSISRVAKEAKIPRPYLTAIYKEGQEFLQKKLK